MIFHGETGWVALESVRDCPALWLTRAIPSRLVGACPRQYGGVAAHVAALASAGCGRGPRVMAACFHLQGISSVGIEGLVWPMLASRDRRPRGRPASGLLDRAFCRTAGTFPSWEAGRRADEPIDPECSHANPGSTSTCAGDRGPLRPLPPRLPALPSPTPPCGDNECRESVTRPVPSQPAAMRTRAPRSSHLIMLPSLVPALVHYARAAGLDAPARAGLAEACRAALCSPAGRPGYRSRRSARRGPRSHRQPMRE
jgi:hypothetical protein